MFIGPNVQQKYPPHFFYDDPSFSVLGSDSYNTLSGFIRKVNKTYLERQKERRDAELLKNLKVKCRELKKEKKKKIKLKKQSKKKTKKPC